MFLKKPVISLQTVSKKKRNGHIAEEFKKKSGRNKTGHLFTESHYLHNKQAPLIRTQLTTSETIHAMIQLVELDTF